MVWQMQQSMSSRAWRLAREQHGVISRRQLLAIGFSPRAIEHRLARGRLHPVLVGIYSVGSPGLSRLGRWMAAVLCCGDGGVLSHRSAAALWGIGTDPTGVVEVSSRSLSFISRDGVRAHRRPSLKAGSVSRCHRIPVTDPVQTLLDLATMLGDSSLERAVNEADRLDLVDPESLRAALETYRGWPGVRRLRLLLDRRTFRLTDSRLEQLFLPLCDEVGLSGPLTRQYLNGFRVDFYWPDLGLVVETDSLRHHRTPAQQTRDHLRDQAHLAAGLTPLRFTHAQVRYEPEYVRSTLRAVARRLTDRSAA
jgi:very-short-patch-repair endonuclease